MSYTQSVEPSTFLELIKKRGPLTIWEMSVTIETDISRVQEKIEPLIKEEVIVPYEEQGRTYYKIPGGENNHKKNKSIFAPIAGLFNKKLKFEISTLSSLSRIEKEAVSILNLKSPESEQVKVIVSSSPDPMKLFFDVSLGERLIEDK